MRKKKSLTKKEKPKKTTSTKKTKQGSKTTSTESKTKLKTRTIKKSNKSDKFEVTPYREIVLSDGEGFIIKTTCNLTSDDQIQVIQYREHVAPEGNKFACTEPIYFENKTMFLEWLMEMLKKNFEDIPFITISPINTIEIKKHEREAQDTMYL